MDLPIPAPILRRAIGAASRWMFNAVPDWSTVRNRVERATCWLPVPGDIAIADTSLGGVPASVHIPRNARTDGVMLYLHGGGYVTGSSRSHRALVARLAQSCEIRAYALDYRLAPEHRCPAAFEDVQSAYQALLEAGWSANQIAIVGDSAGAALALMLSIAARDTLGLPQPAVLGLICPPVEHEIAGLIGRANASSDPVLTADLMGHFIDAYVSGSADVSTLELLRQDLSGLAPMVIDAAGRDLLLEDARQLAGRARIGGVRVHYTEYPGQMHVFHIMAGLLRQANRAVEALARNIVEELAGQRMPPMGAMTPGHQPRSLGISRGLD